jgi:hypothetical protein
MEETEEKKKKNKELQEVMPNYKVQLKSKIILERDMKTEKNEIKVFETNIDELIKNKIQLSSHKLAMEEMDKRQTNYGSFAAFALNENEKLRNFNFTTAPNFEPFEFVPILEIRKMNEMKNNENNENNIMSNNQSKKKSINNLSKRSSDKGDDISDSSRQYGSEAGKSTHKQYTNSEKRHMKNESKDFVGEVIKESINTLNENETNEENNNERNNNEENNNERNNNEDNNNFQEYEDNEEEDI